MLDARRQRDRRAEGNPERMEAWELFDCGEGSASLEWRLLLWRKLGASELTVDLTKKVLSLRSFRSNSHQK
jgi:hypothetical protein